MGKSTRAPSKRCVDCGSLCWGRSRNGKQEFPRCHACANARRGGLASGGCGTVSGYRRHLSQGVEPCGDCRAVNTANLRAYRQSRKVRGLLAQKRRTDYVYKKPETFIYPACVVCGEKVTNRHVRSDSPTHNACKPSGRQIAISKRGRQEIYERDGSVCQLCDGPVDLTLPWTDRWSATLDHIIPYSLGGPDDPSNLRLAHRSCNSCRGAAVA